MTSEREQRKAQMAAAAARRAEPDARPAGRTAIRSKPVRITLDLSPELYRQLTAWADSAAVTLDVPRVPLAAAVRAMIRVAADNPDDVLDRLRRDREQLTREITHDRSPDGEDAGHSLLRVAGDGAQVPAGAGCGGGNHADARKLPAPVPLDVRSVRGTQPGHGDGDERRPRPLRSRSRRP